MLTEKNVIGLVSIEEDGHIQVRTDTVILRDDVEIARTYHRTLVAPGEDTTSHDTKVQSVAAAVWAPEVVQSYQDKITLRDLKESKE